MDCAADPARRHGAQPGRPYRAVPGLRLIQGFPTALKLIEASALIASLCDRLAEEGVRPTGSAADPSRGTGPGAVHLGDPAGDAFAQYAGPERAGHQVVLMPAV